MTKSVTRDIDTPKSAATSPSDVDADVRVVLVVEDEPIIRIDIADELRQWGYQVIEAGTADEAIVMLRSTAKIDVLLTDVWMPGSLDGLDLVRAARRERPDLRVVVLSGHTVLLPEDEHLVDRFFVKPAAGDQLAAEITKFFRAESARHG